MSNYQIIPPQINHFNGVIVYDWFQFEGQLTYFAVKHNVFYINILQMQILHEIQPKLGHSYEIIKEANKWALVLYLPKRCKFTTMNNIENWEMVLKKIIPRKNFAKFFQTGNQITEGVQGKVYYARQRSTKRVFACKTINKDNFLSSAFESTVRLQHSRLAKLNHSSIVHFEGYYESHGQIHVVLQLVKGQCIQEWRQNVPLYLPDRKMIMKKILQGVQEIHKLNIVHGCLISQNVFLNNQGDIKILGFGHCKGVSFVKSRFRQTQKIFKPEGNPPFDPRATDIYCVGLILLDMIYRMRPFKQFFKIFPGFYIDHPDSTSKEMKFQVPSIQDFQEHELLTSLLNRDAYKRPSATQALNFQYFSSLRR